MMPSTFSNFVSRDPYSNLLGGYVKRPFQIAEDVSAAGATQAYAIDSKPVNLCFAAKLQSGTSAAATIEQSSDGGATWSTVASITLDTVGTVVTAGPFRVVGDLLRCNFSAVSGSVDVWGGE